MTDAEYTGLLLIIDRSGSMESIRDDMIGGLTQLLRTQAEDPGRTTVDIVQFDDVVETVTTLADPADVRVELEPRGSTALLDALGRGVIEYGRRLAAMPEAARPGTVIVVVATDGHENASREFRMDGIRELVERQQSEYAWEFMFLGANQDAVLAGTRLGFRADSAIDFDADGVGTGAVTTAATALVSRLKVAGGPRGFTEAERKASKRRS